MWVRVMPGVAKSVAWCGCECCLVWVRCLVWLRVMPGVVRVMPGVATSDAWCGCE